jgi:osmotically-inducible protein OsmY
LRTYLSVAIAGLLLITVAAPAAPREIADRDITTAIEREFISDEGIDANAIDMETQKGVVTFKGTVDSILAKERAAKIAESIKGVRAIVNRITVEPGLGYTDAKLQKAVKNAFITDPAADAYEISVTVNGGVVTLTGKVDSWQEKQLSESVAKGVKGVTGVINNITVVYKTQRPDAEIEKEVEARLANDVWVDDRLIDVAVEDEKVMLTGKVGSLREKSRARSDGWVSGVDAVDVSGLEVAWWVDDEMRRKDPYVYRSDDEIEDAVKKAFLYDPRVISFRPTVEVENGTVTLTGVVDNYMAKKAAEQDAENTVGVRRVKNYLKVRPATMPTNVELERRVRRALKSDPYVDRFDVTVNAYNGWIYLTGNVNTSFEKEQAGRVVESLNGVVEVVNNLDFEYEYTWKPDWEIREDIDDELWWSTYVDSDEVSVIVEDGVATLYGTVDSWSERSAAEENAYEGGAKDVQNDLRVNSW